MKAIDVAKHLMKRSEELGFGNHKDGNKKMQKLLTFSNLVSLYKHDTPLFQDDILAFEEGCVVENVLNKYRGDYLQFKNQSLDFEENFTAEQYDVINTTVDIFGKIPAKELSDLNHCFDFWDEAYEKSLTSSGYKIKENSVVSIDAMKQELHKIEQVLNAYEANKKDCANASDQIFDVVFHYRPGDINVDDEVTYKQLEEVARRSIPGENYTVYKEKDVLVVY